MSDFTITSGNTTQINDTLMDATGVPVDLTGATVAFAWQGYGGGGSGAAVVLDAAAGTVRYTMTPAQSAVAGSYQAQWAVTVSGATVSYPTDPMEMEILPAVGVVVPSSYSRMTDFVEPVRAILGDFRQPFKYEDSAVLAVLRTVLRCGLVTGYSTTPDMMGVNPVVTDARSLAVLVHKAAKMFVMPNAAAYSYRTRALSESFGNQRDFVFQLEAALYDLEQGDMFHSFQSWHSWVNGVAGVNVWGMMTRMNVNSPVASVTIGSGGFTVNTT